MSGQRGAAGLLTILAGLGMVGVTGVAGAAVSATLIHARVEAAADMVALGAASRLLMDPDPCVAADRTAQDNDVTLAGCAVAGLAVTVTVLADLPPVLRDVAPDAHARARARAELVPGS